MIRFRIILFLGLSASMSLSAQNSYPLHGHVTDPQGKAVPEAQVFLYRQNTASPVRAVTDAAGNYVFERVASGSFLLEVRKGNLRASKDNLEIDGKETTADVELQLSGVNEQVLVTANGAAQSTQEVAKAISTISFEEIQARDVYSLSDALRTTPGVLITNGGGPGQNTSMRIRGLRPDAAAVLVNMLFFGESRSTARLLSLCVIVAGVVGLKAVS